MYGDSKKTVLDRFYTLLHWQLAAQLPRPGGVHKYSHGALYRGFTTTITTANGSKAYLIDDIIPSDVSKRVPSTSKITNLYIF